MKNTLTISLIAVFIPFGVAAQQTLDINVYHPDAIPTVPYIPIRNTDATSLSSTNSSPVIILNRKTTRYKANSNTNYYTGKTGFRDSKGRLRYEHYDNVTNELIITDSTETIVERIVQISKNRFNILNNKDILIAYLIRNFRVVKKYTPEGKLIKKIKIPNQ